jgi:hypothetical protein
MIRSSRSRVPVWIGPGVKTSMLLIELMPVDDVRQDREGSGRPRRDGLGKLDLHGAPL